jgi:hypothetical protein
MLLHLEIFAAPFSFSLRQLLSLVERSPAAEEFVERT